jgi:PAS domain-containing protein
VTFQALPATGGAATDGARAAADASPVAPAPAWGAATPAVLDVLDVGVACVGADWRITFVNTAWCEALGGVDARAFVGADLWTAFPAFAAAHVAALVRATRADGVPRDVSIHHADVRVHGTFDVGVRRTTVSASGDVALVLTVRNATAQKRLEHVQDRLLESIGEGLLVIAPDWTLTYVNAAAERAAGVARARVLGRPLWRAFPALAGSAFEAPWRAAMVSRRPHAARTVPSCGARAWSPSSTPRATRCPTAACSCCSAR